MTELSLIYPADSQFAFHWLKLSYCRCSRQSDWMFVSQGGACISFAPRFEIFKFSDQRSLAVQLPFFPTIVLGTLILGQKVIIYAEPRRLWWHLRRFSQNIATLCEIATRWPDRNRRYFQNSNFVSWRFAKSYSNPTIYNNLSLQLLVSSYFILFETHTNYSDFRRYTLVIQLF